MPDLDIVTMQQCSQLDAKSHVVNGHHVLLLGEQGSPRCDCKAFEFSKPNRYGDKTCKHIAAVEDSLCKWHEQFDGKPETDGICPRCGGPTTYVRVAI